MPRRAVDDPRAEAHAGPPRASPSSRTRPFARLARLAGQLNPTIRLGLVEFTFGGHILWMVFFFVLVGLQPVPMRARLDLIVLLVLFYAAFQGGRIVHELGHAGVGVLCGRQLRRVRITATVMAVWFPETDPAWPVRLTSLAGGLAQAAYGVVVLLLTTAVGGTGPAGLRQPLEIVGAMHIGGVGNLLPLPRMDGQYVWGTALRIRPVWLAYAPSVLCPVLAVGVICPLVPDPVLQEILAAFAQPQVLAALLVFLLAGLPLVPRLYLPTELTTPGLGPEQR